MTRKQKMWWKMKWWFFRYDIPNFFKNVWVFRKALWKFRPWDGGYNLGMFRETLEYTLTCMENGHEEPVSLGKKLDKMRRAIELLKNVEIDNFIERAEEELGPIRERSLSLESFLNWNPSPEESAHQSKVYKRAQEIEEAEWKELWEIIKGQDGEVLATFYKTVQKEEKEDDYDYYQKIFDGSGIKSWWD